MSVNKKSTQWKNAEAKLQFISDVLLIFIGLKSFCEKHVTKNGFRKNIFIENNFGKVAIKQWCKAHQSDIKVQNKFECFVSVLLNLRCEYKLAEGTFGCLGGKYQSLYFENFLD